MQNLYIIAVNKHIFRKVNIIPVIGKADSCTPAEIEKFKTKVITFFEVVVFDVVAKYPFQLLKYQWLEGRFDTLGKLVSAHPGGGWVGCAGLAQKCIQRKGVTLLFF